MCFADNLSLYKYHSIGIEFVSSEGVCARKLAHVLKGCHHIFQVEDILVDGIAS